MTLSTGNYKKKTVITLWWNNEKQDIRKHDGDWKDQNEFSEAERLDRKSRPVTLCMNRAVSEPSHRPSVAAKLNAEHRALSEQIINYLC